MNRGGWCVIKFALENSVEAVPTNWLQDNQCYWPNYNEKNIQKAIINREEPDKGEWKLYAVTFFRNSTFDNYELAQKKARRATYTSDLESDVNLPAKRKIILKRYSSTSEEEVISVLPPPPALATGHRKVSQNVQMEQTILVDNDRETCQNQALTYSQDLQNSGTILPKEQANDSHANELLMKVMRKLNIHNGLLTNILEKLNSIEQQINNNKNETLKEVDSIFTKFEFPISTVNVLDQVEQYLSDKDKFLQTMHEIYRLGGTTPYDFIARCLSKLMTNTTASEFSYYGRRSKKPFNKLHLNRLILNAGVSLFKENQEIHFEKAIAVWLKRAKERKN